MRSLLRIGATLALTALLLAPACDSDSSGDETPIADVSTGEDVTSAGDDVAVAPPEDVVEPIDIVPAEVTGPATDEPENVLAGWDYLVVTTEELEPAFARLADWRRRLGLPTHLVTMSEVLSAEDGVDDAERLRNFIRTAVDENGTQIVLLGADTPDIPHRTVFVYTKLGAGALSYETSAHAASELYYGDLDGDWDANGNGEFGEFEDGLDMWPDVAVGRVPARSLASAESYVDKVLVYERAEAGDYQDQVLFMTEDTGYGGIDSAMMLDPWETQIFHDRYDVEKLYFNPELYPDAEENSRYAEVTALEGGKGMVVHLGHGSRQTFALMGPAEVNAFENAPRHDVFFSCACYSGDFVLEGDGSTGEQYILNPNGGGVAYLGNTDIGIGFPPGAPFLAEVLRKVLDDEAPLLLGPAVAESRFTFMPNGGGTMVDEHADRYTQFILVLLGDPALRVWRWLPEDGQVEAPEAIAAGGAIELRALDGNGDALVGATATVYQKNQLLLVTNTDGEGYVRLYDIDAVPGDLQVTISHPDFRPLELTIPVTE